MPKPLPRFYIQIKDAKNFVDSFRRNKWSVLSQATDKSDTLSLWYSMAHFTELLGELIDRKASGVRLYLTQYPDSFSSPAGYDCGKQIGIIFVVTREVEVDGRKYHKDIFLEEEPDFPERQRNSNYDYGSPCPTDCDGHIPRLP